MKVSYKWLQTYFAEQLPLPETVAELLTFHVFEIESLEKKEGDVIFDIKVLPDRACYALSHWGIAKEISYITGLPFPDWKSIWKNHTGENTAGKNVADFSDVPDSKLVIFDIQNPNCRRASFLVFENLDNRFSSSNSTQAMLVHNLTLIDQRSINPIVDITNFVMYDMGQPIHAFDFDKLVKKNGKAHIILTSAKKGDQITALGGKIYTLDEHVLVFADANNNNKPLDIAGIKGGTAAQIDEATKNIVVMGANFNPAYIRRTSKKLDIRTDASKRSENDISVEFTTLGLAEITTLLATAASATSGSTTIKIEGKAEYYPTHVKPRTVICSRSYINKLLGVDLSAETLESLFKRLNFTFTKHGENKIDEEYEIHIPYYRLDISISQDIVEEVGRLYGYEKLPAAHLPDHDRNHGNHGEHGQHGKNPKNQPDFYYTQKIRHLFTDEGFSEVYTYSLLASGEVGLANPLASDKSFLRANLTATMLEALELNAKNADLLGLANIQLFEIGTIFPSHEHTEHVSLAFGCVPIGAGKNTKKWNDGRYIAIITELSKMLGITDIAAHVEIKKHEHGNAFVAELNLSLLIASLPEPIGKLSINKTLDTTPVHYKPFSPYPFIVRDIALFVPETVQEKEVEAFLVGGVGSSSTFGGASGQSLLARPPRLFDVFGKQFPDGSRRTSYAFRLVFQSPNRTLIDAEVSGIMERITNDANARPGWQVR